jgi:hypothetical protein
MQITVKITKNYGRQVVYPVCDTAKLLSRLAGHTTLTNDDLHIIKQLGYELVIEAQTLAA